MFAFCRAVLAVLLGCAIGVHVGVTAVADDRSKDQARPANDNAPARDSAAASLPDDIKDLLALVKDIHSYDPNDPDERADAERQRKQKRSYAQVETVLDKIHRIATPADKELPGFTDAMALRLVFRTIILPPGPARAPPQNARNWSMRSAKCWLRPPRRRATPSLPRARLSATSKELTPIARSNCIAGMAAS